MKRIILTIFVAVLLLEAFQVEASSLSRRLSGMILLDVEKNGEAWYVSPENLKRYYLGRPNDAFQIMRELSVGILDEKLKTIPSADDPEKLCMDLGEDEECEYDFLLTSKMAGSILLQVEGAGEAWYVNPKDLRRYYLGRPDDAFKIMRELSLGISREDLALIHKPGYNESLNQYSKYEYRREFQVEDDIFYADVIEVDLDNPNLKIITDTADNTDCDNNCSAESLAKFAVRNKAFAGINGTYFDTSYAKKNYSFFPVYSTRLKKMINEDQLKYWTTGPIMAFDTENNFYYFKDSREFKSVAHFEEAHGAKLQAAIGNKPRLIEDGKNYLIDWQVDGKQAEGKYLRNVIAYKKDDDGGKGLVYLVIVRAATVPDLAEIMKVMEVDYALNLDGGYSAALYYNDEIMLGPGRDVVNAILFSE